MEREVYCNECKEDFVIKELKKASNGDLEETYFNCPHCNSKYLVLITDARLRGLIQRKNELEKEIEKRELRLRRKYL